MSSASKPSPGRGQRNQETPGRASPNPAEKEPCLTGEKRSVFRLNLTRGESDAEKDPNTENERQKQDLASAELQNAASDCDNHGNTTVCDVEDEQLDLKSLDRKRPEKVEIVGFESAIVKPTAKPRKSSLKVANIVSGRRMEQECVPETAQEARDETETAQMDSSTLKDGVLESRENAQDFDRSTVSDLEPGDVYHSALTPPGSSSRDDHSALTPPGSSSRDDHSALTPPGSSCRDDHSALTPPGSSSRDDHSALTPPGSSSRDDHSALTPPGSSCRDDHSALTPPGSSSRDDHSALAPPGSSSRDDHSALTPPGSSCRDDHSALMPPGSSSRDDHSALTPPGSSCRDDHSALTPPGSSSRHDHSALTPPGSSCRDDHSALNHVMQPVLITILETENHEAQGDPGLDKSKAVTDDCSASNAGADSSLIDKISSENQDVDKFKFNLDQTAPKEVGRATEIVQIGHLRSEEANTLATPCLGVATPCLAIAMPSVVAVATPPRQEVGENIEETASETDKSAPVNHKLILPTNYIINPAPALTTTPISDQATPSTPQTSPTYGTTSTSLQTMPASLQTTATSLQTTPTSLQTTPTSLQTTPIPLQTTPLSLQTMPTSLQTMPIPLQTTPTSLQTTPTSLQTTPTSLQTTPIPLQTTPTSLQTTPLSLQTPPPRLRGYLMKRGGALKAWKQRWFVFAEERNSVVYFRTPQDLTPLGQVCLSHASFTCEEAEPGVFYLHTPERTVTLKAHNEELKFHWLQQLQLRRWIHQPQSQRPQFQTQETDTGAELFPQLQCVEEVNTEETTSQPLLLQLSLKHPFIELQNSVQSLRRRSSNDCRQSVFYVPDPTLPTAASTANQETGRDFRSAHRKSSPAILTPPLAPQATPPAGHVTMRRSRSFLRRSTSSWSERSRLQQELQDQKELVLVLQKALELCQAEKRSQPVLNQDPDLEDQSRSTEVLEDLRRRLEQTQAEVEELKTSLTQRDQTILELKKEVRELSEKNQVKQQVIQKLSSSMSQWAEQSSDVDQGSVQSLVQQNLNLEDDLRAFRKQNHFLNSEIHHLSGLWRTSTESQRVLMSKVSAQRGQYLRVLRELQDVSLRDTAQSEDLKNIIQDALSLEQSQLQNQGQRDRDQYGFQLVQDFEVEDIKLLIKIQAPDLRSTQSQDTVERPLVARWDQFMSGCRGELSPSPELKSLIRTGVPPRLRPQVWNWIVRTRTQRQQDPLHYQQLCEKMGSSPQSGSRPWSRQIDLDLPRTLCTNQHFSSPSSPALQQLRRILLAFSWENPSIGYCQGLNRIAGLLLLVLGSEEDSFWALKAVVENIMPPEYYSPSLVGSQADQLVLKDFLAEKLPRLSSHLERVGVDVSSSTFTWFLVVFVEVLPSHILLPLWDAFLYEGSKVLFRFSLALFKLKEPEILQLSTPLELHQYFRVLPKTVPDYRRLSSVAFDELNPFSRRAVGSRRALHLERLQRELCDLRRQQSEFISLRRKSAEEESAGGDQEEALDNSEED